MAVDKRVVRTLRVDPGKLRDGETDREPPKRFTISVVTDHQRRDGRSRGWGNDGDVIPNHTREVVLEDVSRDALAAFIAEAAENLAYLGEDY